MKILFVWTGVTSYMADCWRKLQQLPDVELKVIIEPVTSGKEFNAAQVLHGLDYQLVSSKDKVKDKGEGERRRVNFCSYDTKKEDNVHRSPSPLAFTFSRPDIIFAVGWHSKVVREIVTRKEWRDVPKVCCFDLPWRWQFRCIAAKFVLRPFLRRYSAAYVPGQACERYAKWLGFRKIYKGLFSIDAGRFEVEVEVRGGRRTNFLYVGRMAPEKRVDLIERAYARYRELGGTWTIDYYGGKNFRGPEEMPRIYAEHACLVLASAFDPWPLVALEAKAAGCEVIQSDRCGNRFELDTRVVPFGDVEALARMMVKVENEVEVRGGGGRRTDKVLVSADAGKERKSNFHCPPPPSTSTLNNYDCSTWAKRTLEIAKELT